MSISNLRFNVSWQFTFFKGCEKCTINVSMHARGISSEPFTVISKPLDGATRMLDYKIIHFGAFEDISAHNKCKITNEGVLILLREDGIHPL